MKRLFLAFGLCLVYLQAAHATVSPNTIWEYISTATAGNVNGCAFDPTVAGAVGVDGSRDANCSHVVSDLVVGAVTTEGTSVLTPFLSTHTGNAIHVLSGVGCTVGWHMIMSESAGTITTLSSLGSAASVCAARVTGACSFNSALDDEAFEAVATSNTVYFRRNGVFTSGENITIGADASVNPVNIIGYSNQRDDGYDFNTSKAGINYGANTFTTVGDLFNFKNMSVTGTTAAGWSVGGTVEIRNCVIRNTSSTPLRVGIALATQNKILFNDISSNNGTAVNVGNTNNIHIEGNYIHHSSFGVSSSNSTGLEVYLNNLFESIGSTAISYTGTAQPKLLVVNNTFVGDRIGSSGTAIAITVGTQLNRSTFNGNIFAKWIQPVFKRHGAGMGWDSELWMNNNFFSNTLAVSTTVNLGTNNYALDPQFRDIANGDFRVGVNMKGIAFPTGFGVSASTPSMDMGAVQTEHGLKSAHTFIQ